MIIRERIAVLEDRDVGERVAVHQEEIRQRAGGGRRPARRGVP